MLWKNYLPSILPAHHSGSRHAWAHSSAIPNARSLLESQHADLKCQQQHQLHRENLIEEEGRGKKKKKKDERRKGEEAVLLIASQTEVSKSI